MTRARVVIAGLGDTGLLTAIHLSRHVDVVAVSATPALVSGQELGLRLVRPAEWARDYLVDYSRYRRLDGVRIVHGVATGLDLERRVLSVGDSQEPYDVLVIATGVTNGFWRPPGLRTRQQVDADVAERHRRLAGAGSIAVVGGGAASIAAAANLAQGTGARIDLYFPGDRALPRHHGRVWGRVSRVLQERGVGLHPDHRAELPESLGDLTDGPVRFTTGQPPADAELVLWATGQVEPHTDWLPSGLLDDDGFVRVDPDLRLPGHPEIFAVGDVAATDPLRSSARNRADRLVAHNVRAVLAGGRLKEFKPPGRRWGSVLGPQAEGLRVFAPNGRSFLFPRPIVRPVLRRLIVERGIYKGIRR